MRSARAALLAAALLLAAAAAAAPDGAAARRPSDGDAAATASSPAPAPGASTKTIAQRIDEALENEFPREADPAVGKTYSEKAKADDATVETVVKVSSKARADDARRAAADKPPPPPPPPPPAPPARVSWWPDPHAAEKEARAAREAAAAAAVAKRVRDAGAAAAEARAGAAAATETDVDRIIDSQDNEYVLSRPKDAASGLTLDPQLVRDLTVVMAAATAGGAALEAAGQPQISGYFLAGSAVGPGGLRLVKEIVQVESLAQLGVQLLLFTLGLESSGAKLRAVRGVALGGGAVQLAVFTGLGGVGARALGGSVALGLFIGALVAMSSTSVVVKCLADARGPGGATGGPGAARAASIVVGTLILQDCAVGLLFAATPALAHAARGGAVTRAGVAALTGRTAASLAAFVGGAAVAARAVLPRAAAALGRTASAELYQLAVLSYCLLAGWASSALGLSSELGAFVAGAALAPSGQRDRAAAALEPAKCLFLALFIASTGLVMSPRFLLAHARVLFGGLLLTVAVKAGVVAAVVRAAGAPPRHALAVGLALAQISEFAFVLLSAASAAGLLTFKLYQLVMGVTALSLLATPFLVRAAVHLADGGSNGGGGANGAADAAPPSAGKRGGGRRPSSPDVEGGDAAAPPRGPSGAGGRDGEARRLLQRHTANGDG